MRKNISKCHMLIFQINAIIFQISFLQGKQTKTRILSAWALMNFTNVLCVINKTSTVFFSSFFFFLSGTKQHTLWFYNFLTAIFELLWKKMSIYMKPHDMCTQQRLRSACTNDWLESFMSAWGTLETFLYPQSTQQDSDQTVQKCSLTKVFARPTWKGTFSWVTAHFRTLSSR